VLLVVLVCSFLGVFLSYTMLFNPVRKELSGLCGPRLTRYVDCLSCYIVCSGVVDLVTASVGNRILLLNLYLLAVP